METSKKTSIVKVDCYAGHKGDERPVSFFLDGTKIMVEEVIDQWRGPEFEFFKVLADDGKAYLLKCNLKGEWMLERAFKS